MKFKINFYKIKKNFCKSFYKIFMKIAREYWINSEEFQVKVEILTELRTNLCDQTSVLYYLTPLIVGSLIHNSTSLVDYSGWVGEWVGI